MDRLIAAATWNEPQSLMLAVLVARHQSEKMNWRELDTWVLIEGIQDDKEVVEFYEQIDRTRPSN
jgi:hypothetical protein